MELCRGFYQQFISKFQMFYYKYYSPCRMTCAFCLTATRWVKWWICWTSSPSGTRSGHTGCGTPPTAPPTSPTMWVTYLIKYTAGVWDGQYWGLKVGFGMDGLNQTCLDVHSLFAIEHRCIYCMILGQQWFISGNYGMIMPNKRYLDF